MDKSHGPIEQRKSSALFSVYSLVEEFMLLANMAVAHRINNFYPDKALLRRHPPPQEKMLENLVSLLTSFYFMLPFCLVTIFATGFPQALEIMENLENTQKSSMHGKIMEFEKNPNNHGKS